MKYLFNNKIEIEGFDNALIRLTNSNDTISNLGHLPLAWFNEKGQLEYRKDLKESLLKKCESYIKNKGIYE